MKTVLIGLGNPLLKDDGVGIRVIDWLKDKLPIRSQSQIETRELHIGGMRLIEALEGFDKAIIVDAMVSGERKPGDYKVYDGFDAFFSRNTSCAHDLGFHQLLEVCPILGIKIPEKIKVIGIEADSIDEFGEELTEKVEKSVIPVGNWILNEIESSQGREL